MIKTYENIGKIAIGQGDHYYWKSPKHHMPKPINENHIFRQNGRLFNHKNGIISLMYAFSKLPHNDKWKVTFSW